VPQSRFHWAGYRYHLSILQAESALTQVLDRPRTGQCFAKRSSVRILTSPRSLRKPAAVRWPSGRVAEWPKAAVCYGGQGLQNVPEIDDFRPSSFVSWLALAAG
jgi:hypothetical protein